MGKAPSKSEQALLDNVGTMTVEQAEALSKVKTGEYLKVKAAGDAATGSAMFGPAVVLNRLIHLGHVVDGRRKNADQSVSFGTWGKDNGIAASATVSLFKTLARAIDHGITPASDPVTWAHLVQYGTKKHVTEALSKNPGVKNTEKVRQACVEVDNGTAPKSPRKPGGNADQTADKGETGINVGNVERVVTLLRSWVDTSGNLSALAPEALATIHAHLTDMAEAFEAEGHRAATANRKTSKAGATPADVARLSKTA